MLHQHIPRGTLTLKNSIPHRAALDQDPASTLKKLQSGSEGSIAYNLDEENRTLEISLSGDEQRIFRHGDGRTYMGFQLLISKPTITGKRSQSRISYTIEGEEVELGIINFTIEDRVNGEDDINHHTGKIELSPDQIILLNIAKGKVINVSDQFSTEVLEILNSNDYNFFHKKFLYQMKGMGIPESEQINLIMYLAPNTTIQQLSFIERIYGFFNKYGINEGVIEELEGIKHFQMERIQHLESNTYNNSVEGFMESVIFYLNDGNPNPLSTYIKEMKIDKNDRETPKQKLKPLKMITFSDFKRKMKQISRQREVDIDELKSKKGAVIFSTNGCSVNIGASAVSKPRSQVIKSEQQTRMIEILGCTRAEWLDA